SVAIATGDATFCKQCQVALSMHSVIQNNTWTCEYCDAVNQTFLDEAEVFGFSHFVISPRLIPLQIPRAESIDYLITPAATSESSENTIVVFAIGIISQKASLYFACH